MPQMQLRRHSITLHKAGSCSHQLLHWNLAHGRHRVVQELLNGPV